jgi:hypothetical protein
LLNLSIILENKSSEKSLSWLGKGSFYFKDDCRKKGEVQNEISQKNYKQIF